MTGIFRLSRLARRLALLKAAPATAGGHVIYVTQTVGHRSFSAFQNNSFFPFHRCHLTDWIGIPADSSDTRRVNPQIGGRP
jgi:hypothetical protein